MALATRGNHLSLDLSWTAIAMVSRANHRTPDEYSRKVQQRRRNPPMFSELRTHSSETSRLRVPITTGVADQLTDACRTSADGAQAGQVAPVSSFLYSFKAAFGRLAGGQMPPVSRG
jgi:hypothetical protein